jgi:hypothetical protein
VLYMRRIFDPLSTYLLWGISNLKSSKPLDLSSVQKFIPTCGHIQIFNHRKT